jgi:hypothetical protein
MMSLQLPGDKKKKKAVEFLLLFDLSFSFDDSFTTYVSLFRPVRHLLSLLYHDPFTTS